jgi:hypothetical protein
MRDFFCEEGTLVLHGPTLLAARERSKRAGAKAQNLKPPSKNP